MRLRRLQKTLRIAAFVIAFGRGATWPVLAQTGQISAGVTVEPARRLFGSLRARLFGPRPSSRMPA